MSVVLLLMHICTSLDCELEVLNNLKAESMIKYFIHNKLEKN